MATLDELLQTTSRTFALAIPLLPEPERLDVTLGYLIFRIADTLEDAESLSPEERIAALADFANALESLSPPCSLEFAEAWAPRRPIENAHYQRLIEQTPDVLGALAARPEATRRVVVRHALRSIEGMQATLRRADGAGTLRCDSVEQLREYCYHVAGIVGELLTEMFEQRLGAEAAPLHDDARWFGEGLQLVNILKDADADAEAGRTYLPDATPLDEVFAIAADDLTRAARYIDVLRAASAPAGYIAFTRAPRELAVATLAKLRTDGPGAKISRAEVAAILEDVQRECDAIGSAQRPMHEAHLTSLPSRTATRSEAPRG